ncbi:hypothetical protein GYA44_01480 [Candidatus Microgenomates bacterium]|nr:hypothetical protein [Candidatus Microgenomates bacterium]
MKKENYYESLGFVEALIAIIVVGASSIVLMQIAVNTMQSMIQNDTIDKMTQYAVETSEIVQDIANRDKESDENLFPDIDEVFVGRECFVLTGTESEEGNINYSNYEFLKDNEAGFVGYQYGNSSEYKTTGVIQAEDELFRLVCLEYPKESSMEVCSIPSGPTPSDPPASSCFIDYDKDPKYVTAKIIIGQRNSDGTVTKGNQVKDYTYYSVIRL